MPSELLTQRGDTCPNQPAGDNVLKPPKVCRTVQSQAVGRDVPSTADSDSADLAFPQPDTGVGRGPRAGALQAPGLAQAHCARLQRRYVGAQAQAQAPQV